METSKPHPGPVFDRRAALGQVAAMAAAGSTALLGPTGDTSAKSSNARNGRRHDNNACVQHCRAHGHTNCQKTCRQHVQPR